MLTVITRLAVDYLFLVDDGAVDPQSFHIEPFNARSALNDYEVSQSRPSLRTHLTFFCRYLGRCEMLLPTIALQIYLQKSSLNYAMHLMIGNRELLCYAI